MIPDQQGKRIGFFFFFVISRRGGGGGGRKIRLMLALRDEVCSIDRFPLFDSDRPFPVERGETIFPPFFPLPSLRRSSEMSMTPPLDKIFARFFSTYRTDTGCEATLPFDTVNRFSTLPFLHAPLTGHERRISPPGLVLSINSGTSSFPFLCVRRKERRACFDGRVVA